MLFSISKSDKDILYHEYILSVLYDNICKIICRTKTIMGSAWTKLGICEKNVYLDILWKIMTDNVNNSFF